MTSITGAVCKQTSNQLEILHRLHNKCFARPSSFLDEHLLPLNLLIEQDAIGNGRSKSLLRFHLPSSELMAETLDTAKSWPLVSGSRLVSLSFWASPSETLVM